MMPRWNVEAAAGVEMEILRSCESSAKGQKTRKTNTSQAMLSLQSFFQDENTNDIRFWKWDAC